MGSVRSSSVLTVNSQWGWCFLSMRKELRHFLLFKQGPFFFQRTGKATRDSHSASNKPSSPILGTKAPERRKKKYGLSCFPPTYMSVVSILFCFTPGFPLNFPYAICNTDFTHSQSTLKGYQQDDTKLSDKKQADFYIGIQPSLRADAPLESTVLVCFH